MTDHTPEIYNLRGTAEAVEDVLPTVANDLRLAADLLQAHDDTGISLDNWESARNFVERHVGRTIEENHV